MGKHHTAEERVRIIAAVRAGLAVGISIRTTAHRLGITQSAFYRWVRLEARSGARVSVVREDRARWSQKSVEPVTTVAMRAVVIVPEAPQPATMPTSLSLVAPSGHRIEGLTVEAAAALLRALA